MDYDAIPSGNMTVVQVPEEAREQFRRALINAAGNRLSLEELPRIEEGKESTLIPSALERAIKDRLMGRTWEAALLGWGAINVNSLTYDSVNRLIDIGKISGNSSRERQPKTVAKAAAFTRPTSNADWHLASCAIPEAWAKFPEEDNPPWTAIRVGHVDTGYSEHAALGWRNGESSIVSPAAGYDFLGNDPDSRDSFNGANPGHGTKTSALVAGYYVDSDRRYFGAAPGARIIPYRVTESVVIASARANVAAAIDHAVHDAGCEVVSISLGFPFGDSRLADAIDRAYLRGTIIVCAAGNYWGEVIYPGRYNRVLTVGGVGPNDKPWAGSAFGSYVDVCAPSDGVRRVRPLNLPPGQSSTEFDSGPDGKGTSYATALCAGIAALWIAHNRKRGLEHFYSEPWKKVAAFKKLVAETARRPDNWDDTQYGKGIIDAAALLEKSLPPVAAGDQEKPARREVVSGPQGPNF